MTQEQLLELFPGKGCDTPSYAAYEAVKLLSEHWADMIAPGGCALADCLSDATDAIGYIEDWLVRVKAEAAKSA